MNIKFIYLPAFVLNKSIQNRLIRFSMLYDKQYNYHKIKAVATEPVPVLQFSLWSAGIIEYVPITSVFYNIR